MHLPDGIIPLDQAIVYWIITVLILCFFFYKFRDDKTQTKDMIKIAIFSVCCFILSAVQVPSPLGIPIHFFLIPVITLIIGPVKTLMVSFISLLAQALILSMGGITSLGANFIVMGFIITMILSTIIWYQWIKPYQISRDLTIKSEDNIYLWIPKELMRQEQNHYYFKLN